MRHKKLTDGNKFESRSNNYYYKIHTLLNMLKNTSILDPILIKKYKKIAKNETSNLKKHRLELLRSQKSIKFNKKCVRLIYQTLFAALKTSLYYNLYKNGSIIGNPPLLIK